MVLSALPYTDSWFGWMNSGASGFIEMDVERTGAARYVTEPCCELARLAALARWATSASMQRWILWYNLQDISIWVYHILSLACNLVLNAAQNFLETGPFLSLTRYALTRSC